MDASKNTRRNGKAKPTPSSRAPRPTKNPLGGSPVSKPVSPDPPVETPPTSPSEELVSAPDQETLLDSPLRKQLPQIPQRKGPKCLLHEIILHNPDLYARLIMLIRNGVSFNVAAEMCGISERRFFEWAQLGERDTYLEPPLDSFYSRFYLDVRRAAATKTAECEQKIGALSPTKWLSQGPGRIFGGRWGQTPQGKSLPRTNPDGTPSLPPPDEAIDGAFTITHDPSHLPAQLLLQENSDEVSPGTSPSNQRSTNAQGVGGKASTCPLSPEQEYEALEVLESIGQVTLSPSMRKAFQEQISSDAVPEQVPNQEDEDE